MWTLFLFVVAAATPVAAPTPGAFPQLSLGHLGLETGSLEVEPRASCSRSRPGPGGWPPPVRECHQAQEGLSLLQTATRSSFKVNLPHGYDGSYSPSARELLLDLLSLPGRAYDHIAVDVTYHGLWGQLWTFPERRPRVFNVMLATVKTWSADLVVQLSSRKCHFDAGRSAAFAAFGFIYIGLAQWFFYVSVFTWVCPNAITFANRPISEKFSDKPGQVDLLKQVCLDNFVLETLIYFPVFYVIKEVVRLRSWKAVLDGCRSGLDAYRANFWQDNMASWAVWIPVDVLIFAAPMWLRMPLDHAVSWLWTMLLSYMRGGERHGHAGK